MARTATDPALSKAKAKQFRQTVNRLVSDRGMSLSSIAKSLGYGDTSPLYKIMRGDRTPTESRLAALQALESGRGSNGTSQAKASTPKSATKRTKTETSKPSPVTAEAAPVRRRGPSTDMLSPAGFREFEKLVDELYTQGLASKQRLSEIMGFEQPRSFYKAMRRKRVRKDAARRVEEFASQLRSGAAPASAAVPVVTPATTTKAASTRRGQTTRATGGTIGGTPPRRLTEYLQVAHEYLDRAKRELEAAQSTGVGQDLLGPGVEQIIDELDSIGSRLSAV